MTRVAAALCGVVGVALLGSAAAQEGPHGRVARLRRQPRGAALLAARANQRAATSRILQIAWRWYGGNFGPTPEMKSETTPLMIGGVLYATAGATRNVVAIDAGSGETLWIWRPNDGERFRTAPRRTSGRGVAYWSDGGRRPPRVHRDAGLLSRVARCGNGLAEARVRRGRHRGFAARVARADGQRRSRLVVAAARRRRRRRRGSRGRRRRAAEREDASEARRARLRCAHGPAAVDVPHDSRTRRVRLRHLAHAGLGRVHRQRAAPGGRCPPTPSSGSCTCPSKARRATCMAASVTATTCSATASLPST